MTKKHKEALEKYKGYFFLAVDKDGASVTYDHGDDKAIFAAAFASAMKKDEDLFDILSTAILALIDDKLKK